MSFQLLTSLSVQFGLLGLKGRIPPHSVTSLILKLRKAIYFVPSEYQFAVVWTAYKRSSQKTLQVDLCSCLNGP